MTCVYNLAVAFTGRNSPADLIHVHYILEGTDLSGTSVASAIIELN